MLCFVSLYPIMQNKWKKVLVVTLFNKRAVYLIKYLYKLLTPTVLFNNFVYFDNITQYNTSTMDSFIKKLQTFRSTVGKLECLRHLH